MTADLSNGIVSYLPHLRAFARMLARDRVLADELVQETVLRALMHADQFRPDTNLKAWLTTILRNCYFNERRSQKRFARLADAIMAGPTASRGEQEGHIEMLEFERAFSCLPAVQREALALIGAGGLSYDEAAAVSGCATGTMKSRTSRARLQIQKYLDGSKPLPEALPHRRSA
jgi:RNA polymerase sigma-70 factor, ECF subfamily